MTIEQCMRKMQYSWERSIKRLGEARSNRRVWRESTNHEQVEDFLRK
jgi:hypothetical protein